MSLEIAYSELTNEQLRHVTKVAMGVHTLLSTLSRGQTRTCYRELERRATGSRSCSTKRMAKYEQPFPHDALCLLRPDP
jgi:hypothetical protein